MNSDFSPSSRRVTPTVPEAAAALRAAAAGGDEDWTFALALEVRDQLRANLPARRDNLALAWQVRPTGLEDRWVTLLAAFVAREFETVGLPAPTWAAQARLTERWVLDTPRLTDAEVVAQTPSWLAVRNIYVAAKDLTTL